MPRNLSPGGRSHKILKRLSEDDAMVGHLFEALGYPHDVPRQLRQRFWRLMDYLQAEGLIWKAHERRYQLLPEGARELARLEGEQPAQLGQGSVRIFRRDAA